MKKEKTSKIDELYLKDLKKTAMYFQAEKTAYELKLLYEWCCPINDNLNTIYESTFKKVKFSEKEKEIILANALQLLKIRYHIEIQSENPLLIIMDK